MQRGQAIRPAQGFVGSAINSLSPGTVDRLRVWRETLDNRWQEWVLGYNRNSQFDLLRKVGISTPDAEDLGRLLTIVISAAGIFGRRVVDVTVELPDRAPDGAHLSLAIHTAAGGALAGPVAARERLQAVGPAALAAVVRRSGC